MSENLVDSTSEVSQKTKNQKTVEDLVREKISDKNLTEDEVSEILARFQSEREKVETNFNSCKIDLQNETATELYNLAKETLSLASQDPNIIGQDSEKTVISFYFMPEESKKLYKELISKIEERCEFLKPQENKVSGNILKTGVNIFEGLSREDKKLAIQELNSLDEKSKEIFKQNIPAFLDYVSHYGISLVGGIIDFKESLNYIGNLPDSFKNLKENISSNLQSFLHLQKEFKKMSFQKFSFEDVLSLAYSESGFNPNAISNTGSVGLLQTTTNVVKDISERPDLYETSIVNELASRNGVSSLTELSKESRSRFDNSIVLGLLYLKQLEVRGNTYEYDVSVILKDKENFFKLTTKYLGNKGISITREQFDGFLNELKNNPSMLADYSALKDYNGQKNKYSGEKYSHRVYYAVSILCMSKLMKKDSGEKIGVGV